MSDEFEPTFRRPTQQDKDKEDPLDGYKSYFAYWEAVELERRRKAQQRRRSLSVYERARLANGDDY